MGRERSTIQTVTHNFVFGTKVLPTFANPLTVMQHYNLGEQHYAMEEDPPLTGTRTMQLTVGHGRPVTPSGVIRNHTSSSSRPAPYTRSKPTDISKTISRKPKAPQPRRIPNYNDSNPTESDNNWNRHVQVVGGGFRRTVQPHSRIA
jgi:hypothetical protein